MKANFYLYCAVACIPSLAAPSPLFGQTPDHTNRSVQNASCNQFALQSADTLTLKQRSCYSLRQMLAPELAISSVTFATVEQFRNSPFTTHERWSKFPHRVETYYARHEARDAAEFLVGYLHHEDPRPAKPSGQTSFWRRTNASVLCVLTSPDADGHLRPALSPIAGSFGSAFAGTIMYRHSETLPATLTRTAVTYGFYFVRSFFREFRPEVMDMVHKVF